MLPTSSGVRGTADARNEQRREKQRGTQRKAQRLTRGVSKQRERATLPPQRPPCRGRRTEEREEGAEARRGVLLSSARQRQGKTGSSTIKRDQPPRSARAEGGTKACDRPGWGSRPPHPDRPLKITDGAGSSPPRCSPRAAVRARDRHRSSRAAASTTDTRRSARAPPRPTPPQGIEPMPDSSCPGLGVERSLLRIIAVHEATAALRERQHAQRTADAPPERQQAQPTATALLERRHATKARSVAT